MQPTLLWSVAAGANDRRNKGFLRARNVLTDAAYV